MTSAAPLIVGGGPAGAAAAIALARAGLPPLLIERDAETRDALCGGFLSWATIRRLTALGVDPLALGAHPVERVVLFSGARSVSARLPAPRPPSSRRALDTALLERAQAAGAAIQRGIGARALENGRLRLDDGGEVATDRLVLATGKHELRGAARPRATGDRRCRPALAARAEPGAPPAGGRADRAAPVPRRLCGAGVAGGRRRQSMPRGAPKPLRRGWQRPRGTAGGDRARSPGTLRPARRSGCDRGCAGRRQCPLWLARPNWRGRPLSRRGSGRRHPIARRRRHRHRHRQRSRRRRRHRHGAGLQPASSPRCPIACVVRSPSRPDSGALPSSLRALAC